MKAVAALLVCVTSASTADLEWPRLAGIVHATNEPQAVVVMPRLPPPDSRGPASPQLQAGEAVSGFEVLSIDPGAGTVRLRHTKSAQQTDLKLAHLENRPNYTLHFERAPLTAAIDAYQILSGRTVVHSPQLSSAEIDVHIPGLPRAEVLAALAKALEAHDAWLIPYADKFAFAVPARDKALAESAPPPHAAPADGFALPAGMLKFTGADVLQVMDFYAQLSQRTVLRPGTLRGVNLTFSSQTPLNREEAIWLVEAALRLGALITVPAGEKFAFIVPPNRVNGLPAFDPARQLTGNAGLMNLREADGRHFLEMYAALIGRKALPIEDTVPHAKFSLHTPAPLNPAEAAFALEAVAMLNNFALQRVGDNEVKLVPRASLPGNQKL